MARKRKRKGRDSARLFSVCVDCGIFNGVHTVWCRSYNQPWWWNNA